MTCTTTEFNIKSIETILNSFLISGKTPPKTSDGLMDLFKDYGSKYQIINWFKEGRITWVQGATSQKSEDYQNIMNKSILHYLTIYNRL